MAGAGPDMRCKVVRVGAYRGGTAGNAPKCAEAARNTIDRSITFARREAVNTINADLKLSKTAA